MDVHKLAAILERVLADPQVGDAAFDVWVHLIYPETPGGRPRNGPLNDLLGLVESEPDLALFRDQMVVIPGRATRTTPLQLAVALVRRAQEYSVQDAINGLVRYLDADVLHVHWTVAIEGISVKERHTLGSDLSLVPPSQLSKDQQAHYKNPFGFGSVMDPKPGAILQRGMTIKRAHVSPDDLKLAPRENLTPSDLLLCLGLIGPCAPSVSAQWFASVEWWPTAPGGTEFPPPRWPTGPDRELTASDVALACEYYDRFLKLGLEQQDRLRIPMERLNIALLRLSEIDKIIDLGIALEALLLSGTGDDHGEPTFKVQVRGAWLMGANSDERAKLTDELRGLYHLRNKAVHSGRLPPNHQQKSTHIWINEGAELVARGIIKILNEGFPSAERWRSLVVGA